VWLVSCGEQEGWFDMTTALHQAASVGHGARAIEDRATRRAIAEARERQHLSPLVEPAQLDFADYLGEFCSDVALASDMAGGVQLGCAVSDGLLPIATAVGLALIADELIENAFQHGFPAGRGGRIAVCFLATPDAWLLMVEDSGVGRPQGTPTGAGLRMVTALTTQLGGELVFAAVIAGSRCTVTLPRRWSLAGPDAEPRSANCSPSGLPNYTSGPSR
jgi:two-component sensor histidine kinase